MIGFTQSIAAFDTRPIWRALKAAFFVGLACIAAEPMQHKETA